MPKVAGRPSGADVAVEFVPYDAGSPEEMEQLKKLTALIKERHVPVANLDLFKPGQVVTKVKAALPHRFNANLHARAGQCYGVRPRGKSERSERTKSQYCVYDKAHGDYLYTQAWVELLVKELGDQGRMKRLSESQRRSSDEAHR